MAKIIFLIAFTCIHAFAGIAAGILAAFTQFNMCGPARPATPLTYKLEAISSVLLSPIALPVFWLPDNLSQSWLMPVAILVNSYCWGLSVWHGCRFIRRNLTSIA